MSKANAGDPEREETIDYYYYLRLIAAKHRVAAFQSAVQSCVRKGDVVVEVGAGLGTYSIFAAQSGAKRVYAIEKQRVILIAQELAAQNGVAERITFVRGDSTEVTLPEKADVLVVEDFSSLFVRRGVEELIHDALERHLKREGVVVPEAVSLNVAPVDDAQIWKSCLNLEDDHYRLYGLDLSLLRQMMLDSPHVRQVAPRALLSQPVLFKTIDLKETESYLFDETLQVNIDREGTMYGLAAWFDMRLTANCLLINAPSNPESHWGQVFFPFSNPLNVTKGEVVTLRLSCARSSRTRDIWWTWQALASSGVADHRSFQGVAFRI